MISTRNSFTNSFVQSHKRCSQHIRSKTNMSDFQKTRGPPSRRRVGQAGRTWAYNSTRFVCMRSLGLSHTHMNCLAGQVHMHLNTSQKPSLQSHNLLDKKAQPKLPYKGQIYEIIKMTRTMVISPVGLITHMTRQTSAKPHTLTLHLLLDVKYNTTSLYERYLQVTKL